MTMKSMSRSELVDLHLSLLKLEEEEEKKRQKKLIEESTLELVVKEIGTDDEEEVYVLTLVRDFEDLNIKLPKHCIEQGSQVSVLTSLNPTIVNTKNGPVKPKSPSAVVTEVTPVYLALTFSYEPKFSKGKTVFIKPTEALSHTQLSKAMQWLKNVKLDRAHPSDEHAVPLIREMFKEYHQESAVPGQDVSDDDEASPLCFINGRLEMSQRKAVALALRDRRLTVIHGPPGTGKTTTLVEVILQHVQRGQRVLVCTPSNKAVDNVLEGLWKQTKKTTCGLSMETVFRLGNLARMEKNHRRFSPKLQLRKRMKKSKQHTIPFIEEAQQAEREMAKLMKEAFVVMSTLTSVRSVELYRTFDLLVIDECAQATEAACWLAIPLARKVLLAGDPCQLPPTILSQEAARRGLAVSLMERQMELHGEGVVHMLDTQYRMHELIQAWSSRHLYDSQLKAAPEVSSRLLTELPRVRSTERTKPTLLLVDTDGCKLKETRDTKTSSCRNNGEANLVVSHAKSLVKAGVRVEDIGVITPYKQQVVLITGKMKAARLDVEVNSVDGYQGREKEAILLSLVRSNAPRKVGFVSDRRRLNVAVTRARRHLFVVCDTGTVCRDETIRSLVMHMEENGEARSAYCEKCPRKKDRYSNEDDVDADDISRVTNSLGAMSLKRRDMGLRQPSAAASERRLRGISVGRGLTKRQLGLPWGASSTGTSSRNSYQQQSRPARGGLSRGSYRPARGGLSKAKASLRRVKTVARSGSYDGDEFSHVFDDYW